MQASDSRFQPLTLDSSLREILDAINEYRRANFFQLEGPIMQRADNPDSDIYPRSDQGRDPLCAGPARASRVIDVFPCQ